MFFKTVLENSFLSFQKQNSVWELISEKRFFFFLNHVWLSYYVYNITLIQLVNNIYHILHT